MLDCRELPEYNCNLLASVWENILKEYEKLTNHYEYTNQLRKVNNDTAKLNRLTGIIACYYLIRYQSPNAKQYIDYWDIPENEEALFTLILQEKTKLNIEALRNKKPTVNVEFDFDKMIVNVENNLARNIDLDSTTVKKWVHLCKSIEEKNKQIEKLHARRENNG